MLAVFLLIASTGCNSRHYPVLRSEYNRAFRPASLYNSDELTAVIAHTAMPGIT